MTPRRQQGVALLEVLVALTIFSLAVGSYIQWYSTIVKNTARTTAAIESVTLRNEVVSRLKVNEVKDGEQLLLLWGDYYQVTARKAVIKKQNQLTPSALGGAQRGAIVAWSVRIANEAGNQLLDQFDWYWFESVSNKKPSKF